ncbi:FAD binding domain-containing protein [Dehalobacter sp. DCM]|uniref:FAD binding domain-containing protein n=1 Tax=Dehalobacter sp. DCM TaxID=2907827 RepID=UPI003081FA6F|nr:FAD binding domain-containing protein [Dehalobacter sp. DCM]
MLNLKEYYQPQSLQAALKILAESDGALKPLAGGTDIVPALGKGELNTAGLVDLSKIEEIRGIRLEGDEIRIGSVTAFSHIEASSIIRENVVLLAQAAGAVGSPQIRNSGTIGGNIANASPAADTVTALVTLDAEVKLNCLNGSRIVPVCDVLRGVGKTTIEPQEIITEIIFKIPPAGSKTGFIKLGRRKALAIARMSMAVIYNLENDHITDARVGIGAVGPNPKRYPVLEESLIGKQLTDDLIDYFANRSQQEVTRVLGTRPSAVWKNEAVKGIARDLLSALFMESRQGVR